MARGGDGLPFLQTMANTANDGYMIPEQVWDQPDPTTYGYQAGTHWLTRNFAINPG